MLDQPGISDSIYPMSDIYTTKLIKGVHILFVQGDGKPCYGVQVQRTEPKEQVEDRGYLRNYLINDRCILRGALTQLGIPEASAIEAEISKSIR